MAEVTFLFKESETKFQIERTTSMEIVCQKYAESKNISLKSLYFKYKGNEIDLKLSFNDIANEEDKTNGKIEISVLPKDQGDKNEDNDKTNQLYEELENEFGLSHFVDKNIIKNKIRELNFNKKLIEAWAKDRLLNSS